MYRQQQLFTKINNLAVWSISQNFCTTKIWNYMVAKIIGRNYIWQIVKTILKSADINLAVVSVFKTTNAALTSNIL